MELLVKDGEILVDFSITPKIKIKKGLAKAILPEERGKPYYENVNGARDYDTAYQERILGPLSRGLLISKREDGTIKFDDRKLRYNGHTVQDGMAILSIGPTHFGEMQSVDIPAISNPEFFSRIKKRGLQDFGDEWAYFSAPFAVNAVPVTREGYAHVFKRSEGSELYGGYWHVIGGMLDTDFRLFDQSDPTKSFLNGALGVMRKEFEEETGICGGVELEPTGLVRNLPGVVDLTYIAHHPCNSKEFTDLLRGAEDAKDHSEVKILKSKAETLEFLMKERKIVPGGRCSLTLYANRY